MMWMSLDVRADEAAEAPTGPSATVKATESDVVILMKTNGHRPPPQKSRSRIAFATAPPRVLTWSFS